MGTAAGVPMTIKDSFDTAGVVSTGGTLGRARFVPERDATVAARLRAAVVRAGTSAEGLPIGVQIVAAPGREDIALAVARHVESAVGGFRPPPG